MEQVVLHALLPSSQRGLRVLLVVRLLVDIRLAGFGTVAPLFESFHVNTSLNSDLWKLLQVRRSRSLLFVYAAIIHTQLMMISVLLMIDAVVSSIGIDFLLLLLLQVMIQQAAFIIITPLI